ncbi:unnamed protein product [Macrosiphum euphorbiae]|uniref:Uncharacterized protein n=1 Tax=Macrosiphum euphorbiae TaxID=13131 RepID=A0AAV0Y3X3_9HEMI|nr:unnamed protein product [Macrosiphum euphorbiae]
MPFLQGYVYPVEDLQPLHDLLKEWNLECTYQTLLDELIDLKILAIRKVDYHTNELLKNYPLGIKILFSNNLEKWQNSKKIIFYDITASNYFGQKTFSRKTFFSHIYKSWRNFK